MQNSLVRTQSRTYNFIISYFNFFIIDFIISFVFVFKKNELGYSKVFDKFKDYVNDCMSESNFDEQYDECMEEIGKKAVEKINENKIEKIVEKANVAASNETSRNRKDDFVAALKEKKCADKLTEDDDENVSQFVIPICINFLFENTI